MPCKCRKIGRIMSTETLRAFAAIDLKLKQHSFTDESLESVFAKLLRTEQLAPPIEQRLLSEVTGQGPLERVFQDDEITEILVLGPKIIFFEKNGQMQFLEDGFLSEWTFENFTHRLMQEAGFHVDLKTPQADGRWREFRVCMVTSPLTLSTKEISFRRIKKTPWTLQELLKRQFMDEETYEVLRMLIEQKKNILVVGPTGCGKTSLLTALLNATRPTERSVILEDTQEIHAPNALCTNLLTRADHNGHLSTWTLTDLVKLSLRLRPDRLIVGEVRGGEAKDLLLALSTGHRGCMGTLHAESARRALWRLEMLVQMGAPEWNTQTVQQLIASSLDAIVVVGFQNQQRRIIDISTIAGLEECGFLLESKLSTSSDHIQHSSWGRELNLVRGR